MKPKRVPMRMCVGCRAMKPKQELTRIVKTDAGAVYDMTGKMPGRGAYICPNGECLARAIKIRALERALGAPLMQSDIEKLREGSAEKR